MISNKREDGGLPWGRADYLNMYRIAERLGMPNEKLAEIIGVTLEEVNDETVDVDKELRE